MLEEYYVKDGKLISQEEWKNMMSSLRQSADEDLQDHAQAKKAVMNEILRAVKERLPDEKFGVLFSGGVDSSLIALLAKRAGADFICYTLGFKEEDTKEPEDVEVAAKAAQELGLQIKTRQLDAREAEELIKKTAMVLGPELNNVVNVGVGGVALGCIEMAKKDNVTCFFSGLGSEEIFAGYQRHRLAPDRQKECWEGLFNMYERDLLRDNAIARATMTRIFTPFLDQGLIAAAMRVPAKHKMDGEQSKIILREIAEDLRLPKDIAWRGKRAAQYGSRLDKAISKIARQKGFKLKKEYLKSLA